MRAAAAVIVAGLALAAPAAAQSAAAGEGVSVYATSPAKLGFQVVATGSVTKTKRADASTVLIRVSLFRATRLSGVRARVASRQWQVGRGVGTVTVRVSTPCSYKPAMPRALYWTTVTATVYRRGRAAAALFATSERAVPIRCGEARR